MVYDALVLDQTTPALGWKMGHVYLVIPISGLFMALFTISNIAETFGQNSDGESGEVN